MLFIGGTGLLSLAVLKKALDKGFEISILNRGNKPPPEGVQQIKADIRDINAIDKLLTDKRFDIVIDFISYNKEHIANNLSVFSHKCRQYIFISSVAAYKKGVKVIVEDESPLIDESRRYSIDKVEAEQYLIMKATEIGFNYTIVRPAITYGYKSLPYGLPYGSFPCHGNHWVIVERILNNKPILLPKEGADSSQPFTHVDDFAVGCVGLFGNKSAYNEAFHIVDTRQYSWRTIVKAIGEVLKKTPVIAEVPIADITHTMPPFRKEEIYGMMNESDNKFQVTYDISKISRVVPEYKNSISLRDGIAMVINEYHTHNASKSIDIEFDAQCDRIVKKYCKKNKNDSMKMKSRYIDYMDKRSVGEKIIYYLTYYQAPKIISLMRKIREKIKVTK